MHEKLKSMKQVGRTEWRKKMNEKKTLLKTKGKSFYGMECELFRRIYFI